MREAEREIIKYVQKQAFAEEMQTLNQITREKQQQHSKEGEQSLQT